MFQSFKMKQQNYPIEITLHSFNSNELRNKTPEILILCNLEDAAVTNSHKLPLSGRTDV